MINPALIAQGAEMRPALSPEEILQNQSIPGYLQQQQQTTDADLPAAQAANFQAETQAKKQDIAANLPAIQAQLYGAQATNAQAEARKQQILNDQMTGLPAQLQSLHAIAQGQDPSTAASPQEDYAQTIRNARGFMATPQASISPPIAAATKGLLNNAQEQLWAQLKPQIDAAMAPPKGGFDPLTGQRAAAYSKALSMIPPELGDYAPAKTYLDEAKAEQQNTVFNPATAQARLISTYKTTGDALRTDFDKKADAFRTAQGIRNSAAWGSGTGDQNLIDQLIIAETGKPPTEAQYRNQATTYGISDLPDLMAGKIGASAKMTNAVREKILSDLQEQTKNNVAAYEDGMNQVKGAASAGGVPNPDAIMIPGGKYNQVKQMLVANAPQEGATKINASGDKLVYKGGKWQLQ